LRIQYTISEDRQMWKDHKQTVMCFENLHGLTAHNSRVDERTHEQRNLVRKISCQYEFLCPLSYQL